MWNRERHRSSVKTGNERLKERENENIAERINMTRE